MNTIRKTTSMKELVQTAFRSSGDGLLPGEIQDQVASGGFYSIEGPVEYRVTGKVDTPSPLDIKALPAVLEFVEGYRPGIVVFAASSRPGAMVTNLPVRAISVHHMALCSNVAEMALLALSVSEGFSLEYLGKGYGQQRLKEVGQDFANEFMRPMADDGKTVIHEIADVRQWLARQVWWRRSTESAPGTEFA